jgi:V/A-type H+/Na+-transporting ATPase subunit D
MPESGEVLATRVAFLELQDERRLVREGYGLLDEKRMLLATEIMRQLRFHDELRAGLASLDAAALAALEAAVGAHGFDGLTVEPKLDLAPAALAVHVQPFLGLELPEAALEERGPPPPPGQRPATPEARRCAAAFRALALLNVRLAACMSSLTRLVEEYVRTERRARALENVVLPEIDGSLRFIEEQLDALDQEEAVRVRNAAARS